MNKLIDIYNHMSKEKELFSLYTSIGKGGYGSMFSFLNTNYRGILPKYSSTSGNAYGYGGFAQGFSILEGVEGKDRNTWVRTRSGGHEKEKQHTVRMRKAVFFQVRDNAFYITRRGEVFKKMLLNVSLTDNEKRLLCFLLILPASFNEIPHYIFESTARVFGLLQKQGIAEQEVLKSIEHIVAWSNSSGSKKPIEELFRYNYTYYDSFFIEKADFLTLFSQSTEIEREEFKEYIINETQLHKKLNCQGHTILTKKFVNGGVYTKTTLIENAWMLYVSKNILDTVGIKEFEQFIDVVLKAYGYLFPIDVGRLRGFIFDKNSNRSVFQIIFCELFNIKIPLKSITKGLTPQEIEQLEVIDPTDENGYNQREIYTTALKKIAKQQSQFKCECERVECCKYFTSKESGNNYLEIHHLIPREFANDFDASIEALGNYTTLCPNCHRKIHLATDKERMHLIRLLFNNRKDILAKVNIHIELTKLFEYYNIEE